MTLYVCVGDARLKKVNERKERRNDQVKVAQQHQQRKTTTCELSFSHTIE